MGYFRGLGSNFSMIPLASHRRMRASLAILISPDRLIRALDFLMTASHSSISW